MAEIKIDDADVGKPKVQSAKETMEAMNTDVKVITLRTKAL